MYIRLCHSVSLAVVLLFHRNTHLGLPTLELFRKNMVLERDCSDRGLELPYQVWLAYRE